MSSEKKTVLWKLIVSAMVAIALYCLVGFFGGQMSDYAWQAILVCYCIVGIVAFNMAGEFQFLWWREPRILAAHDATHRRIAAIRTAVIASRLRRTIADDAARRELYRPRPGK